METVYTLQMQSILAAWLLSSWLVLAGIAIHAAVVVKGTWKIRCFGVLLTFAPILLAGAYEVFWLLSLSVLFGVVLIAGLQNAGCGRVEPESRQAETIKYTIGTVLFFTALAAGAIVLAMRTPALNPRAWVSLLLISIFTSCSSAVVYYAIQARKSKVFRTAIFGLATVLIAIPVSFFDWLLLSLHIETGWPPDMTYLTLGLPGATPPSIHPEWMWFGVSAIVSACLLLWSLAWSTPSRLRRLLISGGVLVFLVPPLILSLSVLHVPSFPNDAPKENAYPQVAALSAQIAKSDFDKATARYGDWEAIPPANLSRIVSGIGTELNDIIEQLKRPLRPPIDFSIDDMPIDDIMCFRTAARALVARGRLRSGQRPAALDCLAAVQLGVRTRRGGLLVQHLAGVAVSANGLSELYVQSRAFDDETRTVVTQQLLAIAEEIEPIQSVLETERKWMVRQGWHNHLFVLLTELSGESIVSVDIDFLELIALQERTVINLLATDIALLNYRSENGAPPESLKRLVPDWLPSVPKDLLAKDNRQLNYQFRDGNYILYSVGINGLDEDGTIMEQRAGVMPMDGDLQLKGLFGSPL